MVCFLYHNQPCDQVLSHTGWYHFEWYGKSYSFLVRKDDSQAENTKRYTDCFFASAWALWDCKVYHQRTSSRDMSTLSRQPHAVQTVNKTRELMIFLMGTNQALLGVMTSLPIKRSKTTHGICYSKVSHFVSSLQRSIQVPILCNCLYWRPRVYTDECKLKQNSCSLWLQWIRKEIRIFFTWLIWNAIWWAKV